LLALVMLGLKLFSAMNLSNTFCIMIIMLSLLEQERIAAASDSKTLLASREQKQLAVLLVTVSSITQLIQSLALSRS
jgi:hypothetical protein